jgi:hypothetical protein
MAKTGNFYHGSTITSNVAAIGTTFDVTKFHEHDLYDRPSQGQDTLAM